MLLLGLLLTLPLAMGPVAVGGITFSLFSMMFGLAFAIAGLQSIALGIVMEVLFDFTGEATGRWLKRFKYDRAVPASFAVFAAGAALVSPLIADYVRRGYTLGPISRENHLAVLGLLLLVTGFSLFTFNAGAARDPGAETPMRSEAFGQTWNRPSSIASACGCRRVRFGAGCAPSRASASATSGAGFTRRSAAPCSTRCRSWCSPTWRSPRAEGERQGRRHRGAAAGIFEASEERLARRGAVRERARAPVGREGHAARDSPAARSRRRRAAQRAVVARQEVLELSAFRLGLSPRARWMITRRTTTLRDLWPMLVEAGFLPSKIHCFAHKLGLNTFAACEK